MKLSHNKGESIVSEDLLRMNSSPADVLRTINDFPTLVREIAVPAPPPEPAQ